MDGIYHIPVPKLPCDNIDYSKTLELHLIFHFLCNSDPKSILKLYFNKYSTKAVLQIRNKYQQTLLHIAIQNNSLIIVKYLLDNGSNIQDIDSYGWSPLHLACYYGYYDIIKELLKRGSLVMSLNLSFATPLHILIQCSIEWRLLKQLLLLFIDNSCDINSCDKLNGTILYYAYKTKKQKRVLRFLLEHGADSDIIYNHQYNTLHNAIYDRNIKVIKLLLEYKANPSISSYKYGDALTIAMKTKDNDIIELIQKYLPDNNKSNMYNHLQKTTSRNLRISSSSVNNLAELHQQFESKKLSLGIPNIPQLYIESFICKLSNNEGELHLWQYNFAFEPKYLKKFTTFSVDNILSYKKLPLPTLGIEIRLINKQVLRFTDFEYYLDAAFNLIEYLHTSKDKDLSSDIYSTPLHQRIGEIKFPNIVKEMNIRFKMFIDKSQHSLIDYCNASMFSTGTVQISLGNGRLYLTIQSILFYAIHLGQEIRLLIDYNDIEELEKENHLGIIIQYKMKNLKTKRRFFTLASELTRNRIYNWIYDEWKKKFKILDTSLPCNNLIAIISPRSYLLDKLIPLLSNIYNIRIIILNYNNSIDSFFIPPPSFTDEHYQIKSCIEVISIPLFAIESLKLALQSVTTLIYIPPLIEIIKQTEYIQKVLYKSNISNIIYITPYIPKNIQNISIHLSNIYNTKQIIKSWRKNILVDIIKVNPVLELFDMFINCKQCNLFYPNNNQISWISLNTICSMVLYILKLPLLESHNITYHLTSLSYLLYTNNDITDIISSILGKEFELYTDSNQLLCNIQHFFDNKPFSEKELQSFEYYIYILCNSIFKVSKYITLINNNNNDIEAFQDYFQSKLVYYKEQMQWIILSDKEHKLVTNIFNIMIQQAEEEVLLRSSLDAPAFISSCGSFFLMSGLSYNLFHALCDIKENRITYESFILGVETLLHGPQYERYELLFKLYQNPSSIGPVFNKNSIEKIITVIEVLYQARSIFYTNEYTIPPIISQIQIYLENLFDRIDKSKQEQEYNILFFENFKIFIEQSSYIIQTLGIPKNENIIVPEFNDISPGIPIIFGQPDFERIWQLMLSIEYSVNNSNNIESSIKEKNAFKEEEYIIPSPSSLGNWFISDFAPCIFHKIRKLYGISPEIFLNSLGPQKLIGDILIGKWTCYRQLNTSGRSGSLFYSSWDGKYFLKTLPDDEYLFLRKNLENYYYYISTNPNSLLTRFYGLIRIKQGENGSWINFIIMENIFGVSVHEIYDLKGSTINRHVEVPSDIISSPKKKSKIIIARKDNDFSRIIKLGNLGKSIFMENIERDIKWLENLNITDYSLLVGIYFLETKDKEGMSIQERIKNKQQTNLFKSHNGGILSEDHKEIYYIGLIDILGQYNLRKIGEYFVKSIIHNPDEISANPPIQYRKRFQKYVISIIK